MFYFLYALHILYHRITSWNNDNWPIHGYKIDEYLPINLFYGKKEGEYIKFNHRGRELKLRLTQTKYRYSNCGNFEDLCTELLSSKGGLWDPNNNEPSRDLQTQMLDTAYTNYVNSFK